MNAILREASSSGSCSSAAGYLKRRLRLSVPPYRYRKHERHNDERLCNVYTNEIGLVKGPELDWVRPQDSATVSTTTSSVTSKNRTQAHEPRSPSQCRAPCLSVSFPPSGFRNCRNLETAAGAASTVFDKLVDNLMQRQQEQDQQRAEASRSLMALIQPQSPPLQMSPIPGAHSPTQETTVPRGHISPPNTALCQEMPVTTPFERLVAAVENVRSSRRQNASKTNPESPRISHTEGQRSSGEECKNVTPKEASKTRQFAGPKITPETHSWGVAPVAGTQPAVAADAMNRKPFAQPQFKTAAPDPQEVPFPAEFLESSNANASSRRSGRTDSARNSSVGWQS